MTGDTIEPKPSVANVPYEVKLVREQPFLNVCYNNVNYLHELCRSHTKKCVLLKLIEPPVWPNSPNLNQVDYAIYEGICSRAWTISKTECAPVVGRILNKRSSTNPLITVVTNWRLWLNGEHTEQLFWLSDSFAVVLCYVAFCHCVSSVTMVHDET